MAPNCGEMGRVGCCEMVLRKEKKQWYVPSANCLLVIGIKRPTSVCYHTGELTPGKVGFFSASAESQRRSFLSQQ